MLVSFPLLRIDETDICRDFRINIVKSDDGYKFRAKMEVDQRGSKKEVDQGGEIKEIGPGGSKRKIDLVVNYFHMSTMKLCLSLRGKELNSKTSFDVTVKFHISGGNPYLEGTIGGQEVDIKLDKSVLDKILSMFN